MRTIIVITLSLLSLALKAQDRYEQGMTKAFELWQAGQSQEASNLFERIAKVETDNWLPAFYVAQINVINSFNEKDKDKLTAQLNKAMDYLNDASALSPENADIEVVRAQWYTAWIVYDGQQYGMKYSAKVNELYSKAKELDPTNPRAAFGKVEWDMGAAQFFGQPIEPYCDQLREALQLFTTFKPAGKFHPSGGEEYARQVVESRCGK